MSNPTEGAFDAIEADALTAPRDAVDAFLAELHDFPEAGECAYCGQTIREHEFQPTSQRVSIERDPDGTLTVVDWHYYTCHDGDGTDLHYSCEDYTHIYPDLDALAREQNEQHALRIVASGDPSHVWNAAGDEPGAEIRLRAIYAAPLFAGRRSRMARAERFTAWSNIALDGLYRRQRWERFLALDVPEWSSAARAEAELAAVGIL